MDTQKKIPLYILTGFLGGGKTTFLEKMILNFKDQKIAVIMNEFGKTDVDGELISHLPIMLEKINNGSIFCSCKSDKFVDVMVGIIKEKPDVLIVESSGLANPATMPKILELVSKLTNESFDLKANIGIMDATNVYKLAQTAVMIASQIAHSDIILLNKVDLASDDQVRMSKDVILEHNPNVEIIETVYCDIPLSLLFEELKDKKGKTKLPIYKHLLGLQNFLVKIETPVSRSLLIDWMEDFAEDVYRIKGFVLLKEGWYFVEVASGQINTKKVEEEHNESSLVILAPGRLAIKKIVEESWNKKMSMPIIID